MQARNLFASMSTACQLYDCCEQVAVWSVLLAVLDISLEEEVGLEDSYYFKFWPFIQDYIEIVDFFIYSGIFNLLFLG